MYTQENIDNIKHHELVNKGYILHTAGEGGL